jgi:hypothetical protein
LQNYERRMFKARKTHTPATEGKNSVCASVHYGTVVVARIYKGAPCTYYSQRLPFEQADCSPSGLGFYVMIFITTLGSLHKRTIHIGVNQIGLAVT